MDKMTDSAVHPAAKASIRKEVEADREDFKPLTREEAQKLREASPSLSPWWVVVGQLAVGVVVACAAWALTGRQSVAWSAFYGALTVVVPAALFVRGLTSKVSSMNAGAAVFAFFLWEMVKIALTVAMLFAAPRLIENLSWPAMLVGLIVTMKVYWGVLWFKPKRPTAHQT
ncbi:ATP synthase subunit I [Polaromonas sp.]|uniref:ATP synthase subunit I n=1 Tax=Polaromonas sp. TaxID=1869339 RepID=UPI0032646E81